MSDFLKQQEDRSAEVKARLATVRRPPPSLEGEGSGFLAAKLADANGRYFHGPSVNEHIAAALAGGIIAGRDRIVIPEEAVAIYDEVLKVLMVREPEA